MIKRSSIVAAIAVLLSLAIHFLGLGFVSRVDQQAQPQPPSGETVTQVVAPDTTFEDVADPVQEPQAPEEPPEEPTPEDVPTSDARIASETPQQDTTPDTGTAQPVEPETTEPATPDTGEAAEPTTVEPTQEVEAVDPELAPPPGTDEITDIAEGAPDATQEAPDAPTQAPAAPAVVAAPAPTPAVPSAPVTPSTVPTVSLEPSETAAEAPVPPTAPTPQPPQETVEAIDSDISDQATAISQRPQLPTKRPTPVRRGSFGGSSTTTTTQRAPSRRIESPLSSYSRSGVDIFAQSGSGARSGLSARNTGNATTTNYAGRVLAQLNRTASVAVSGSGWAQVIFVISASGALASVDVIDGSGSRSINSAAIQQVRSAAPFPPPPSGKSRRLSFSYQIQ